MQALFRAWRRRSRFKKLSKDKSPKQQKRLAALKNFGNSTKYAPLIPDAIKTFLKATADLSKKDLKKIKVMRFASTSSEYIYKKNKLQGIYCDAPWNFILMYNNEAVANIGFSCNTYNEEENFFEKLNESSFKIHKTLSGYKMSDHPILKTPQYPPDSITIVQIQGARTFRFHEGREEGAMKILSLIRWEKLLISIVRDWAFDNGFNEVRVVSAHKNVWYNKAYGKAGKVGAWETRMKVRYDVTSKRMGFQKSTEGGYWFLQKDSSERLK